MAVVYLLLVPTVLSCLSTVDAFSSPPTYPCVKRRHAVFSIADGVIVNLCYKCSLFSRPPSVQLLFASRGMGFLHGPEVATRIKESVDGFSFGFLIQQSHLPEVNNTTTSQACSWTRNSRTDSNFDFVDAPAEHPGCRTSQRRAVSPVTIFDERHQRTSRATAGRRRLSSTAAHLGAFACDGHKVSSST